MAPHGLVFYGFAPGISRRAARPGCLMLLSYADVLPQSITCTSQGPFLGALSIYGKNLRQGWRTPRPLIRNYPGM